MIFSHIRYRWAGIAYELSRQAGESRRQAVKASLAAFDIAHELEEDRERSIKTLVNTWYDE
jgi:hypothetical protein